MKISARNLLQGKVLRITHGAVNDEIVLELSPGVEVTAIITHASRQRLGLEVGTPACAIIKASDVMIGVD